MTDNHTPPTHNKKTLIKIISNLNELSLLSFSL
jgi:hypothetical protein